MVLTESEITENTTLCVTVQVKRSDSSVKSLSGATFSALMGRRGVQLIGSATVLNASQGIVQVRFPAATGMKGQVTASLHVTIGGETQCVWRERFHVFADLE